MTQETLGAILINMAKKTARAGGKFSRSHSSVIPSATEILDILHEMPEVKKISLGIIKAGKTSGGKRYLKLKERTGGLLMTVRGNSSIQEIGIYSNDPEKIKKVLKERSVKLNVEIL